MCFFKMDSLPREVLSLILDFCPPEAYLSFIETGFDTVHPIDQTQYERKKEDYKLAQKIAKRQKIKDGVKGAMCNAPLRENDQFAEMNAEIINAATTNDGWVNHVTDIFMNHTEIIEEARNSLNPEDETSEELSHSLGRKLLLSLSPEELAKLMTPEMLRAALNMVNHANFHGVDDETQQVVRRMQDNEQMQPVLQGWMDILYRPDAQDNEQAHITENSEEE